MALLAVSVAVFLLLHSACLGKDVRQKLEPDLGQVGQDLDQVGQDLDQVGQDLDQVGQDLGHWDNDFDGVLNFRCRDDSRAVTSIKSYHSNHHEDRRFEIFCSQVKSTSSHKSCYWTNYINGYDDLAHFTCNANHYINGMHSVHNNHREDRIWKFRCCQISGVTMEACVLSGWTNGWDQPQHYKAPAGHVFKGMVSIHNNHREDRLYEYLVCKIGCAGSTQKPASILEYLGMEPQYQ